MPAFALRNWLPKSICARLWGDRERWGLIIQNRDNSWIEYQTRLTDLYSVTQRTGVGAKVNDAGYRVMSEINLTGMRVLEIGAGDIRHIVNWKGGPTEYLLADVNREMMDKAEKCLRERDIPYRPVLLEREQVLPFEDNSVDIVVSFYSLEHLYPLNPYLSEMHRVLKPGGTLIGAIPAEGGFAWGIGRMLTSRRWFKKNTNADPDKIICWEHPNFADEIIAALDQQFQRQKLHWWPMRLPMLDPNLIIQFIYTKP